MIRTDYKDRLMTGQDGDQVQGQDGGQVQGQDGDQVLVFAITVEDGPRK